MNPRLPSFPTDELQRISNGEGFVAERMQLLQQARRMAEQNSEEASQKFKEIHNRSATEHNLEVWNKVLIYN